MFRLNKLKRTKVNSVKFLGDGWLRIANETYKSNLSWSLKAKLVPSKSKTPMGQDVQYNK